MVPTITRKRNMQRKLLPAYHLKCAMLPEFIMPTRSLHLHDAQAYKRHRLAFPPTGQSHKCLQVPWSIRKTLMTKKKLKSETEQCTFFSLLNTV